MLVTSDTFLNDWVGYFTWSQCWWTGTIGHGLPTKPSFIFNILFAKIEWKWVDIDWWFKIQRMWWSFKIALWGVDPVSSKLQAGWLLSPEQSYNCPCTITHSRCWLPTQTLEADPDVIKSLCKKFKKKNNQEQKVPYLHVSNIILLRPSVTAACCITLIAVTGRNILQTAVTLTSGGLQHCSTSTQHLQ